MLLSVELESWLKLPEWCRVGMLSGNNSYMYPYWRYTGIPEYGWHIVYSPSQRYLSMGSSICVPCDPQSYLSYVSHNYVYDCLVDGSGMDRSMEIVYSFDGVHYCLGLRCREYESLGYGETLLESAINFLGEACEQWYLSTMVTLSDLVDSNLLSGDDIFSDSFDVPSLRISYSKRFVLDSSPFFEKRECDGDWYGELQTTEGKFRVYLKGPSQGDLFSGFPSIATNRSDVFESVFDSLNDE
jgi:hypothetical protein